jgi:hypothetical protein
VRWGGGEAARGQHNLLALSNTVLQEVVREEEAIHEWGPRMQEVVLVVVELWR